MDWLSCVIIVLVPILLGVVGYLYLHIHREYKRKKELYIKTLQEVACDYHVRVFKSWWGNLIVDGTPLSSLIKDNGNLEDNGCFDMNSNNTPTFKHWKIDYDDKRKFYFINFKVLGKCYLAYGTNATSAWINVIKKARVVNKIFFYGRLDRQKI